MWDDMSGHTYWKSRKKSFTVSSEMRRAGEGGGGEIHARLREGKAPSSITGEGPLLNNWTRARLNLVTSQGLMLKMSLPAEPCVLLIWVLLCPDILKSRMCQISRVIN